MKKTSAYWRGFRYVMQWDADALQRHGFPSARAWFDFQAYQVSVAIADRYTNPHYFSGAYQAAKIKFREFEKLEGKERAHGD